VFQNGSDPIKVGLVTSMNRPGGNATGFNSLLLELDTKRMALLHELVPKAIRVAVLLNPSVSTSAETTLREVQEAARVIGLQLQMLHASTSREIDAAFATFGRERPDALFIGGDTFFRNRRVQLASLAVRDRMPTVYNDREYVAAGGLMSYGISQADMFRQVGVYTGNILKGALVANEAPAQAALQDLSKPWISSGAIARRLQPYLIQVPPKARARLIGCGHATFMEKSLRREQFAVLQTKSLYHQELGLVWEDSEYLSTEGLVI
jgi:putative ABC transport system substrate-binding protein